MSHNRTIIATLACLLGLIAAQIGCSSSPEPTDDEETFIGAPPVDDDDALFRHALPAEAVPADATGMVGDTTQKPPEDDIAPPEDIAPPDDLPEERQACFSCVRICPINDDGSAICDGAPDDLICGWGAHNDAQAARQTARAQCEASLEMARYMPNYSEISGECPQATCR